MDLKKQPRVFTLSGFTRWKKSDLKVKIKSLGGHVLDDLVFSVKCTHVICQKPCRSEKFLSGLATGKWILTEQYICQSFQKGKWLSEEPYEWGHQLYVGTCSNNLLQAPKRARLQYGQGNDPAFSCWKAGLLLADQPRTSVYERLLRCGGAQVVALKAPTSTRLRLPPGLTHVFADQTQHRLAVQLAQAGVRCLMPSYIGDFLTGVETPCKRHFVYYPESSNYCYATATVTSQRNFKKRDSTSAKLSSECFPKQAAMNVDRCKRKCAEHRENEPRPTACSAQPHCQSGGLSSGCNVSMTSTLGSGEPSTAVAKGVTNKADGLYIFSEDTGRSLSVPMPFKGTAATLETTPVCNSLECDEVRTDADANLVFLRTVRSCLEENRSADVRMLLQSYVRPDSKMRDSSLLARIMNALQSEKDVIAGKRYYELLHQISTVTTSSGFKAAMDSVGSDRVRSHETATVSGSTLAWCLISFLFGALLDTKSKAEPGLRSNRLLLLKFLADLFVKDAKKLHDRKPSTLLLYRVMWSNRLYVSISQGPGAALLAGLSKSLTTKDAELTRITLQLIKLLPRLCGDKQACILSRHIASFIRKDALYDHHFLTLVLSELSPAYFKNKVCEFVLDIVTDYEGRQHETATAMTVEQMAKRYCYIPSGASVSAFTADEQSSLKRQAISNHLAEANSTDCETGDRGAEPRRSTSAGILCEKSPGDAEIVACSFNDCCCHEPGQSVDLVAGYLLVLCQLVLTCVELSGTVAQPTELCDRKSASRLALFVSEHVRLVERCVSQRSGRCTISSDALEDLQAIPSVLRALLHCT